LVKIQANEFL